MEDLNVQTIAIPVEEYKELLQKQAELSLIYHKGARGSVYVIYQKNANGDAYGTGTFVQEMRNAFCNVRQEDAHAE